MLKKTITYEDFNGNQRTEDFYFNLSKNELSRMEVSKEGGLDEYLKKIVQATKSKEIYQFIEEIVLKSYGEKSDDGRRFIKSEELSKAFSETPAYDNLIMSFFGENGAENLSSFVNALIPKDLAAEVEKELAKLEKEKTKGNA